eukprot:Gb_18732 [translate_table: standard]
MVMTNDFYSKGGGGGNTKNIDGSKVTSANVMQIAILNKLEISMVQIDYTPNGGLIPPHTHPQSCYNNNVVIKSMSILRMDSSRKSNKKKYTMVYPIKNIEKGEVFIFPKDLVHFQLNVGGYQNVVAITTLNNHLPRI